LHESLTVLFLIFRDVTAIGVEEGFVSRFQHFGFGLDGLPRPSISALDCRAFGAFYPKGGTGEDRSRELFPWKLIF
jgi:hypothetical protein